MKSVVLVFVSLFLVASISFAQTKPVEKAVIKTPNAACEECKDFLEVRIAKEPGVLSVNVNYSKKTTTISWLTDRTNIEELKAAIANFGLDADGVSADETAYKRLPKCCLRPIVKSVPVTKP